MFMTLKYDAIIIGAGQAGPSLAVRLANEGMKVAIVERDLFGGTCVNTGCTPTKTLVASARVAYITRRGREFGVLTNEPITMDMKRVKARKDSVVRESNEGIESWLKNTKNLSVYMGHARFDDTYSIRVKEEVLTADKIFINVGGRAYIPNGFQNVNYFTNSSIMEVDFLPEHLIIIGGSYIGLEFGQIYRRFGSRVTVVEKGPRLLHREDEDISHSIKEILENEGINFRLNAECISGKMQNGNVVVDVDCSSGDRQVSGTHLLLAVGRKPNTDDLGLDSAGIVIDNRGYIKVDDKLQTNVPGIWALGDCNGRGAFTHTSYNDFEIVTANLLDNQKRWVSDRIQCYALYIDPPLGRIGMTENEVRKSGRRALIATRAMSQVSRAREKGETQGFMKVLVDAESKEILGAAVLGVGGDEIIHSLLDVMYAKATYTVIQRAVHIHPTVTELIPTMLSDLKPFN
jgi:pyruvate/2-oxoglutarate dehydrogenase complex dihydrolipoamide dehydrogenase (E3) component